MPDAVDEQPRLRPTPLPLRPFAARNVKLRPGSRFHAAEATNGEYLRLLDVDRLLHQFRKLAGLPQPHADLQPYGGWEGSGLRGHMLGHWLAAASTAAEALGDATLRGRAEYATRVLEECQAAIGDG